MHDASQLVLGCAGPRLSGDEIALFRARRPWGLILFGRNIETPDQVRALTDGFRDAVGRPQAVVLIDQEGGRVARLREPHWRHPPSPTLFARLYRADPAKAMRAAYLNARLIAADLRAIGVNVNCAPMLDIPQPGADAIVTDRALGRDAASVGALGRAVAEGLRAGGVAPVIKHAPGHGRATVDSHHHLPIVSAPYADLAASDFLPFQQCQDQPMLMTAHIVYQAIDPTAPATQSAKVIGEVIRGALGFKGLIVTDDIDMRALAGDPASRARAAWAAGCDIVVQCNGVLADMRAVADAAPALRGAAGARARAAEAVAWARPAALDIAAARMELDDLLQGVATDA
ncbi:MAG: beta-N-acetylhexosaminidase [Sphingomonadales bacterium]